ncbi:MAG: SAM-dependent methyltransferase, partial [Bacteroidales bacterium]|nr:SAM-dependent methyltransferase [Bacteroidales bacterium]
MDIEALIEFVREHRDEDTVALLLKQERYRGVDMGMVAQQIEGWRRAAVKWPSLAHCETFLYPPRLNCEQSSSEATARYKREVVAAR